MPSADFFLITNLKGKSCVNIGGKFRFGSKLWLQGLEGYSRDPGFGQNTVRDSGKRKRS